MYFFCEDVCAKSTAKVFVKVTKHERLRFILSTFLLFCCWPQGTYAFIRGWHFGGACINFALFCVLLSPFNRTEHVRVHEDSPTLGE